MTIPALLLSENFFNPIQYPSHVIAANEAAAGHEAFRVGNGRRSVLDYWTPTTANAEAWNKVTCDRVRAANCVVIDHCCAGGTLPPTA